MAVDYTPVKPGDSTNIKADTWNGILRSADAYARTELLESPGFINDPWIGTPSRVLVKNATGATIDKGAILGISGPLTTPTENETEFLTRCALNGITPTSDHVSGRIVIADESIPADALGWCVISGLTPCKVKPNADGTATSAIPVVGETEYLEAAESGIVVVWINPSSPSSGSEPEPQWAAVLLSGPGQRAVRDVYYLAASSGIDAGIYKEFTDDPVGTRHLVKGTAKGYCPSSSGSSGSCDWTGYEPGGAWASTTPPTGYTVAFRDTAATSPPGTPPSGIWEDAGYPSGAGWVYVWRTYDPCNGIAYGYDPNLTP